MSRSRDRPLTLAEFAERLDRRLKALPAARLRSVLLSHAERLPAGERASFLAIFEASPRRTSGDGDLLADVASVAADPPQFEDQDFDVPYDRYGSWDDDAPEVGWPELDALLGRAADAFQAGRLALARSAYKELFGAILERYEDGTIDLQLDTDLDEAKARYLRALHETLPARERPAALLPDRSRFLAQWRDMLLAELRGRRRAGELGTDAGGLLLEAVALRDGAAGLGRACRIVRGHWGAARAGACGGAQGGGGARRGARGHRCARIRAGESLGLRVRRRRGATPKGPRGARRCPS